MLRYVLLVAVLMVAPVAMGAGYKVDAAKTSVEFTAIGSPGFLRINGTDGHFSGTTDGQSGTFVATLDDFHTGIDLRDHHMKEKYLQTGKYPTATLAWTMKDKPVEGEHAFAGKLTIHGVTKDVTGTVKLEGTKDLKLTAEFAIDLSDYGVDVPSWLGVTVANHVIVNVTGTASGV